MKRIINLIMALIITSCANENKNIPLEKMESLNDDYMSNAIEKPEAFMYQHIYTEKLQNYFDLLHLHTSHPEFREDIEIQLKNISEGTDLSLNYDNKITVNNIQNTGDLKIISDSVSTTTLHFDRVSQGEVTPDSIKAKVIKRVIIINDAEEIATKVTFTEF